jgi:hypothetical protein
MHYRRMDPQPPKGVWCEGIDQRANIATSGEDATGRWPVWAEDVPPDMPGANCWQDRDGEWYWRRETRPAPTK